MLDKALHEAGFLMLTYKIRFYVLCVLVSSRRFHVNLYISLGITMRASVDYIRFEILVLISESGVL